MPGLFSFVRGLRPLTPRRRREIESDVYEELRFHVELRTADNIADGMSPAEARAEAERRFGNPDSIAEACVQVHTHHPARIALRATETMLMLACGIGLASAVFLLLNAAWFRQPTAFRDQAERVAVWWYDGVANRWASGSTFDDFRSVRRQVDLFEHVTLVRYQGVSVRDERGTDNVRAKLVSADYFRLYGAAAARGRLFAPDEEESAVSRVALLSYEYWQDRHRKDPEIVGRQLTVDGTPHTVVGVMPQDLPMYQETALFLPLPIPESGGGPFGATYLMAGRIAAGRTRADVQAVLASRLARTPELPAVAAGLHVDLRPLQSVYASFVEGRLVGGLFIVGLLMVSVFAHVQQRRCANAARPLSVDDLAATPRWVSVMENFLIAALAVWLGCVLARQAAPALAKPLLGDLAPLFDLQSDARVLALTAGIALVFALLLVATGRLLGSTRDEATQRRFAIRRYRLRASLVALEITVAVVLLLCAVAPIRTWVGSRIESPGFAFRTLSAVDVSIGGIESWAERRSRAAELVAAAERLPGVTSASFSSAFPMQGRYWFVGFRGVEAPAHRLERVRFNTIDSDYLETVGIPLLDGRGFRPDELRGVSPDVCIVNQAMAAELGYDGAAVGKQIEFYPGGKRLTIVGVAGNIRQDSRQRPRAAIVYRPFNQYSGADLLTVVARGEKTAIDPVLLHAALTESAPDLVAGSAHTAEQIVRGAEEELRFGTLWLTLFALFTSGLALIGLTGLALEAAEAAARRATVLSVSIVIAAGLLLGGITAATLARLELPLLGGLSVIGIPTAIVTGLVFAMLAAALAAAAARHVGGLGRPPHSS